MPVDIIIPTFNRASVLERSITSALNQSYQDFILHIVDDGSIDETAIFLKKYQQHPKIRLYFQNNKGVSAARNLAAKHCTSSFLAFLDSDDEWMPDKLETQIRYFQDHPECDFVHTEELWIRNGVRVNPKVKHSKSSDDIFLRSLDFCLISPSTVMMKKNLFFQYQGFDEEFIVCEDYDLWLKILINNTPGFIMTALTKKHGGHSDQLSTQFVAMDYWRIKSLIRLFQSPLANEVQKEQIKNVILKKSELLLKNYAKYGNREKIDEITNLLSSIKLISYL